MSARTVTRRASLLVSLIALLSMGLPGTAHADGTDIQFSGDGQNWSSQVEPIFTDTPVLVPGSRVSDEFWVKNAGVEPVFILLWDEGSDLVSGDPAGVSEFQVSVKSPLQTQSAAVKSDGSCTMVFVGTLAPGRNARFTTSVSLPWSASNRTEDVVVRPNVKVGVGQGAASADMNPCSVAGQKALGLGVTSGQLAAKGKLAASKLQATPLKEGQGDLHLKQQTPSSIFGMPLPATGAPAIAIPLLLGMLSMSAGIWLLGVVRRRRREV